MRKKLDALFEKYGPIAIGTYFSIFALTLCGSAAAISFGFQVDGVAAGVGTWGAAYILTKLSQPIRILATIALTPLVGMLWGRRGADPEGTSAPPVPGPVPSDPGQDPS